MKKIRTYSALSALVIVLMVLFSKISFIYAKLESSYAYANILEPAWMTKSGSKIHDAKIDLAFGAAINQIKERRKSALGRMVDGLIRKGDSPKPSRFNDLFWKYISVP